MTCSSKYSRTGGWRDAELELHYSDREPSLCLLQCRFMPGSEGFFRNKETSAPKFRLENMVFLSQPRFATTIGAWEGCDMLWHCVPQTQQLSLVRQWHGRTSPPTFVAWALGFQASPWKMVSRLRVWRRWQVCRSGIWWRPYKGGHCKSHRHSVAQGVVGTGRGGSRDLLEKTYIFQFKDSCVLSFHTETAFLAKAAPESNEFPLEHSWSLPWSNLIISYIS